MSLAFVCDYCQSFVPVAGPVPLHVAPAGWLPPHKESQDARLHGLHFCSEDCRAWFATHAESPLVAGRKYLSDRRKRFLLERLAEREESKRSASAA